ncbi:DUF5658 family protein [Halorientalis regularis]|jgi:hypothetical protein|uniref:DUF5658 domain-containing protein n=1 Tax=Halorientalis regularis TaxID=660518 RepID=A0A1G7H0A2_9EURY|nr:DUF5658 family protein [Halorientalis regularis]SDE93827.1 hypothetical protein SAMN05216218_102268 [Halorientalis regularis]
MGSESGSPPDDSRDALERFERELPESHAVLWTVIIVAAVFDVVTTLAGLSVGFEEGNRVARAFLATYGDAGIGLLKFAALVVLVVTWHSLPDRPAELVLTGFAVVSVVTVALNALTLLSL